MVRFPASFRHLTVGTLVALLVLGAAAWSAPAQAQPPPDLSTALLTVGDLPAGWTAVDPDELDLDDLDESNPFALDELGLDPNGPCAMALAPFESLFSAEPPAIEVAAFQRGELGPFIGQVVVLLPPELVDTFVNAGSNDLGTLADTCADELMTGAQEEEVTDEMLEELGISSIRSAPLPFSQIGDQSAALRMDISFGVLGTSLLAVFSLRDDALSLLLMAADPITATESIDLVEQLALRVDARLMQVLAGR